MTSLCRHMHKALAQGYLAANEDFHVMLYKAAGSPLLFEMIDTLRLKAGPISNQLFDVPEASTVLNDAHADLIKSLARRDSAGVRRAVEKDPCDGPIPCVFLVPFVGARDTEVVKQPDCSRWTMPLLAQRRCLPHPPPCPPAAPCAA